MLFTALLKVREGSTTNERIMRRAQYSYPEGCRPITEYWLQTTDPSLPNVVATYEADGVEAIMALLAAGTTTSTSRWRPPLRQRTGSGPSSK